MLNLMMDSLHQYLSYFSSPKEAKMAMNWRRGEGMDKVLVDPGLCQQYRGFWPISVIVVMFEKYLLVIR